MQCRVIFPCNNIDNSRKRSTFASKIEKRTTVRKEFTNFTNGTERTYGHFAY